MAAAGADMVKIIAMQLGREPAIGFEVEIVCPYGWPAVIRNEPFTSSGKPHSNIYYLTCPFLVREISRLEDASLVARLEEQVAASPAIQAQMLQAQRAHQLAWQKEADPHKEKDRMRPPLIAGSSKPERLKCLHAHVAWGLSHPGYKIADLVLELIGSPWCPDERCRAKAAAGGISADSMPREREP